MKIIYKKSVNTKKARLHRATTGGKGATPCFSFFPNNPQYFFKTVRNTIVFLHATGDILVNRIGK